MEKRTITGLILLFINGFLFAQTPETAIQDIRSKYSIIRENLPSYEETVIELMNESTEGGHATSYSDNSSIKLIEVAFYGEMWKQITAYYFDEDKLIFAFDQLFHYNVPFYLDKERAEEMGLKEYFDPEKTRIEESRFYFADEKLFRYLDKDKKEVDLTIKSNMLQGEGLLEHAREMKTACKEK